MAIDRLKSTLASAFELVLNLKPPRRSASKFRRRCWLTPTK
jgi:hypothetical protein